MFSVRLVSSDSYQAQPLPQLDATFSEFRGSEIKHVPIIRIFGTTSTGEKTCLHIHGVFPYLYVPYTGEEDPTSLAYRLAASLDAAINVSLGSATSNTQHVYLIQRVSGIPFYGYHRKEHQYLKIYFYNPAMIKRAADLLQNGSVLNQSLQPHEAHIPYLLQFMIDYNVYGMSLVNLSGVKHRRLTQTLAELASSGESVTSTNSQIEYLPSTIERQSTCEIEIDALASDIINRREIENGLELNPGLGAIWEEERARRAQAGLQGGDSQLVNPKSPPRPTFFPTDNDIYQGQRLARRLLTISQCDESSLSTTTTNQSVAYAAEVQDGENLLNASHLPFSRATVEIPADLASQRMSQNNSILGTDDMPLIDLLVQLADEGAENQVSVDTDSVLGSQVSVALVNDEKSDNEEDEEDDGIDLNLTSLQLDSLSSLEIAAGQEIKSTNSEEKSITINLSPFVSPYEASISPDEDDTRKVCKVPQYDGAGDLSPTLLNSDDEDNATNAKEFTNLPEFNGNCDPASKTRKFDSLEKTLKITSNNVFVATKDNDKNSENCRSTSPVNSPTESSSLLPINTNDSYLAQYNVLSYEPLDGLLEIDPEFNPDLEGLHSSMEIGILLSSADSDTPDSVDEALEDDAIPLETVLNGDPCFTESAELDKSDLTELQDQYVSLLGNSLLPDVQANLVIDSDMGNSSNFSDSDYQTGEKNCAILLNVQSPRSSITSRESSSSSENVAPNIIQESEGKHSSRDKFNVGYALDRDSRNCKDSTKNSNDNSDYNCNVVATWAELQNLQFVEKEKIDGRLGRSRDKCNSQGSRQSRRRASRRSDERAASQIRSDCEKITYNTLAAVKATNNCHFSSRKIVTSFENKSPMKISLLPPIGAEVTIVETKLTESLNDVVDEKCQESLRVPHIAAEVEIEQESSFVDLETSGRSEMLQESVIGSENFASNPQDSLSTNERDVDGDENVEEESPKKKIIETTKSIPEGFSYYSSERSQRNNKTGFEHRHCQLSKRNKIIQDDVFTCEQVWVIEKRKRGRQPKKRNDGLCISGDCGLPIVSLKKIDVKNDDVATVVENSEKIDTALPVEENIVNSPKNQVIVEAIDKPAEKILSKKRLRKCRVRRNRVEPSSSDSSDDDDDDGDVSSISDSRANEKNSKNKAINVKIRGNEGESQDQESSDWTDAEGRKSVKNNFGEIINNPYGTRRRYSRKKRSYARNSKKMISTRGSRITTRNGVRRKISRLNKHENSLPGIPGIPGIVDYRSSSKRDCSKKNVFNCCNGVTDHIKTNDTSLKTENKLQSVLLSARRPNGIVDCLENAFTDSRKSAVSPNRRTINPPQFDCPPVSPILKRNRNSRDISKNFSKTMSRSSTPKKISHDIRDNCEEKSPEFKMLNEMIGQVKSHSTKAKLKILLEMRKRSTADSLREEKTQRKSIGENKIETQTIDSKISELSMISSNAEETKNSVENDEIKDKIDADKSVDKLDRSFETITDISCKSQKICENINNSFNIYDNSTLNNDICNNEDNIGSEIYESVLEILEIEIPEAKSTDEMSNERKDLSYENDQFRIAEANLFSGNNYTIDAVSHEMPACLFEEDSNSVDKRSPKKVNDTESKKDSQTANDAHSEVSVDLRDLDVYDADSLSPCSSLINLNDATTDVTEMSINTSELTEFGVVEKMKKCENQSVDVSHEKSREDTKSEEIHDSSFEEASPEFEALSPSPEICDFGKSIEDEFTVCCTVEIAEDEEKFNKSLINTAENSVGENREEKLEEKNSELHHEVQNLISEVVGQIDDESKIRCESECANIEILTANPKTLTNNESENKLPITAEENKRLFSDNELMTLQQMKSQRKSAIIQNREQPDVLEAQIEFQQTVSHESEIISREIDNKNDANIDIEHSTSKNEELMILSKNELPIKPPKCRPVSIKLVNIDLSRFEGLQQKKITKPHVELQKIVEMNEEKCLNEKNIVDTMTRSVVEENVENVVSVKIELKEETILNDNEMMSYSEDVISESSATNEIFNKSEKLEKTISMETKPRKSQNCAVKRTENISKITKLPERRSARKCAEKTRQKMSKQSISQPANAESQQSSREKSQFFTDNYSQGPEYWLTENPSSYEITLPENELTNVILQVFEVGNSQLKSSTEDGSTDERGEENSLEVINEKISDENTAPYIKCRKRSRSGRNSLGNSRDTSPDVNASGEENSSGDENVKPKTHNYTNARRSQKVCLNNKRILPLQLQITAQKLSNVSLDSKTTIQQIESNTEDKNIERINVGRKIEKNSDASEEKSVLDSKFLISEKNLVTRIIVEDNINLDHSKTLKRTELTSETIAKENNDEKIFLSPDKSAGQKLFFENSSALKENLPDIPTKIAQEETSIPFTPRKRGRPRKIIKLRNRKSSPKKNNQCKAKLNSDVSHSSPKEIANVQSFLQQESYPKILENSFKNLIETQKIEEEEEEEETKSICSTNSEILKLSATNSSQVKSVQDGTKNISQESELLTRNICKDSGELESCAKPKKRGRPRKILPSIEENAEVNVEKISKISEESKIHENLEDKDSEFKIKKRGRTRKISASNVHKSIDENSGENFEVSEESKLSEKQEEKESDSKSFVRAESPEIDESKSSPALTLPAEESTRRTEEKNSQVLSKKLQEDTCSLYLRLFTSNSLEAKVENSRNDILEESSIPSMKERTENIKEKNVLEAVLKQNNSEVNTETKSTLQAKNSERNEKESLQSEEDIFEENNFRNEKETSKSTEEHLKSINRGVSEALEKIPATPRRGRSGKTQLNFEENTKIVTVKFSQETESTASEEAETKTKFARRRREKNSESSSQRTCFDNNERNIEEKIETSRKIMEKDNEMVSVISPKRTRSKNLSTNKYDQDIAKITSQNSESLLKSHAVIKARQCKISKPFSEEPNFVAASKMTENVAETKILSSNKKRIRSEKSPESKSNDSEISEEPSKFSKQLLSEHKLIPEKIAGEISETQSPPRPRKRVCFDEDSIRECAEQLKPSESSSEAETAVITLNKHRKNSLKLNLESSSTKRRQKKRARKFCTTNRTKSRRLSRHLSTLKDNEDHQRKNSISEAEGNNGVDEKSECTIISSDDRYLDLPSLQEGFMRHRLTVRLTKSRVDEIVGQTKRIQSSRNSQLDSTRRQTEQGAFAFSEHQEPMIILKRLSRDTLKTYGFEFNAKNKIFVKILKKRRPDFDYKVPAYDGPADFSSTSESEDENADVTVAREEKRVCVFQSGKKSANAKRDAIVTPRKRKLNLTEDAESPRSKHRAIATPGTSTKTAYNSPNRTSMLKSPGRVSGHYPPLQIIVTSPKVRRETTEPRDNDVRLESHDVNSSTGDCFTPRRKNVQRLHENLLRGKINAMKSPKNDIGDKRTSPAKMGSQRSGELDEIKSGEERGERDTLDISKISSECSEATGNQNLTSTLRDGKDVRKKLVFSAAGDEEKCEIIHETPNTVINHESTNLRTTDEIDEQFSMTNDARKSLKVLENMANYEITTVEPQPDNSRLESCPVDENLAIYDITTDEESENDDPCNVTFTQYIDSQIEKNQALTLDRSKICAETDTIVCLRPKFNPPSRQRILDTMETYGIPKYRNQEPFFSDENDVPKQKELAQRMLKVPGKGIKDLPAFVSSVEGVTGIARWRRMKINELEPAIVKSKEMSAIRTIVGDEIVSLTPMTKPPTRYDVKKWLRAREYLEKKREEMVKKTKEQIIEIEDKIDKKGEDDCESNALDVSVIEASPEKIIGCSDAEKMLSCTLKMKLAKRGLIGKMDEKKKLFSEDERVKDSIKTIKTIGEGTSATENSSSIEMDPSLLSVMEKSRLFKDQEPSRHLGVSCGQIEFLSDSTRSNVADENLQNAKALTRYQYLTIMCLEVHVVTRGDLLPDAQHDAISAIFYSVQSDVPPTSNIKPLEHGVIIVADDEKSKNKMHYSYASKVPWSVTFANNEESLLNVLVTLITRTDPEILIGWELETLSWGYVFQRATRLGMNLSKRISRIPATQCKWDAPAADIESMADVKLPGRIVLDVWRLMRHEAALLSYTFESMMHHILNERVPCPSFKVLSTWWNLEQPRSSRWRVLEHYSLRVLGIFRMLDQLDIIGRTSELARLFGIQFYEVFSRGSQYRVESVMHRLAKPLNYIAVSPSPLQRASMRAMEALPLIMEPESMFYSDPLIVLDFQSLYPSIIIAHNYCFSTCLGRIEHIGQPQPFEFGAYTLRVPKNTALRLQGKVNYAPCGVAFVKPEVRLGILPRMLTEILETRFMVKKAMKDHKQADKTLQRALHSRQLGLKLLANVTYGYTAANFSGRMPCIEVGDSVVSKSKETLERAIKLVEATPKWGARVVYGDTDSLFILVPGKSKADAFVIGNEIADAVTAANPPPIKLKFEKVMYPSILQTKKRYCGYMYETPDQEIPTYLAKGIETVRRDGCPAVSKILEKTLKILFETKDVSLVKKYVTRQLDKVLRGNVSIQDLTFAKEFRGLKGYSAKACVPALELTRRLMRKDPRAIPRNSERVRYVIVAGAPNQALIHCVRTPWELINDPGLRPNAIYYVTRVIIPPLNRCLNLMGVDVNAWYRDMPHRQILNNPVDQPVDKQKLTIFQYFGTIVCVSCGQPSSKGICTECLNYPADTLVVLHEKLRRLHRTHDQVTAICQSCVGRADIADCSSLDCPILYRRAQAQRDLSQATHLQSIIECGNKLEF